MHSELSSAVAGPAQVNNNTPNQETDVELLPAEKAVVEFRGASKWYGNVIGLNNLTLRILPGVTGLLGPNGAGKSTFLQLAAGQLYPSQGKVLFLGKPVWNNWPLFRQIGICPEQDAFYEWMTGQQFVTHCARLSGLGWSEAMDAADHAISLVSMQPHAKRAIRGYSRGMRQRIKMAQALVHNPRMLFLDEPFTGADPVARRELMDIIIGLGQRGHSVVVSSHILHEVQAVTPHIVLLNRGRLVAQGHVRQIRDMIDKHPHRIVLVSPRYRDLAAKLMAFDDVEGVEVLRDKRAILVQTRVPDAFYSRLPQLALQDDSPIEQVYSDDDNLEAVFKYLVSK